MKRLFFSLLLLLFLILPLAAAAEEGKGVDLGAQAAAQGHPLVADFGMNRCSSCIRQSEIIEKLKDETSGKVEWKFIHIGEDEATAGRYKILLIPTLIFFDGQGKELYRYVGLMDEAALKAKLAELKLL
ncbi:MAG: hypothetical protein C0608_00715 [Deltaproteobacteria bacterium]|nr:MAG: hypothetical protein C0608_00715 [Deltaproteobacteria bacterium]